MGGISPDAAPGRSGIADDFPMGDGSGYHAAKGKSQSVADGVKDGASGEFPAAEGMGPGAMAASHGYGAIDAGGHGGSGSRTVAPDRTKPTIERPEGWR